MKQEDVINAFLSGRSASASHLSTDGRVIYTYAEPLAVRQGNTFLVNSTKYSMTSSCHRSKVICGIRHAKIIEVTERELKQYLSYPNEPLVLMRPSEDVHECLNSLMANLIRLGTPKKELSKLQEVTQEMIRLAALKKI
jgi:hypothetical protein